MEGTPKDLAAQSHGAAITHADDCQHLQCAGMSHPVSHPMSHPTASRSTPSRSHPSSGNVGRSGGMAGGEERKSLTSVLPGKTSVGGVVPSP